MKYYVIMAMCLLGLLVVVVVPNIDRYKQNRISFGSDADFGISYDETTDDAVFASEEDLVGWLASPDNIGKEVVFIETYDDEYSGPCARQYQEFLIAKEYGAFGFSCTGDEEAVISSYTMATEDEARMEKEMLLNRISELEDQLGELRKTLDDNAQIVD